MFARQQAMAHPDKPAIIMGSSGEVVTFGEFEARSNRVAHLLRDAGLRRGDHIAVFIETGHPMELVVWCDSADEAVAAGTPVLVEPRTAHGHRRAYVTDPDGTWITLVSKPERGAPRQRAELFNQVLNEQLPRYAEALERLGR